MIDTTKRPVQCNSPARVGVPTGNFTEYGKPMFSTRQWQPGERRKYCEEVLNRPIYSGECK